MISMVENLQSDLEECKQKIDRKMAIINRNTVLAFKEDEVEDEVEDEDEDDNEAKEDETSGT